MIQQIFSWIEKFQQFLIMKQMENKESSHVSDSIESLMNNSSVLMYQILSERSA